MKSADKTFPASSSPPGGLVLWLTGLSGAGKSTLARSVEQELKLKGSPVQVLDGDELRRGLNSDLGFSPADRRENNRRVAEVAGLLARAGSLVIAALISPGREDRLVAREIVQRAGGVFVEVFLDASLEVCEQRDVKGLYRRARAGELPDFTGIGAPYETPLAPEVTVHTGRDSVAESTEAVLDWLCRSAQRNHGLVDLLLACPSPFEVSEQEPDDTAPLEL